MFQKLSVAFQTSFKQSETRDEVFGERKKVHDASSSEQVFNVKQMHVLTSSSAVSVENSNMYVDIGATSMVSAFQQKPIKVKKIHKQNIPLLFVKEINAIATAQLLFSNITVACFITTSCLLNSASRVTIINYGCINVTDQRKHVVGIKFNFFDAASILCMYTVLAFPVSL